MRYKSEKLDNRIISPEKRGEFLNLFVGESVGWLITLLSPCGISDDATEVHSFEGRIERSEYVVVHGAKGRLRLVFESLVEAMDDTFLEVASSRMRCDDLLALRIGELRITDT